MAGDAGLACDVTAAPNTEAAEGLAVVVEENSEGFTDVVDSNSFPESGFGAVCSVVGVLG